MYLTVEANLGGSVARDVYATLDTALAAGGLALDLGATISITVHQDGATRVFTAQDTASWDAMIDPLFDHAHAA